MVRVKVFLGLEKIYFSLLVFKQIYYTVIPMVTVETFSNFWTKYIIQNIFKYY